MPADDETIISQKLPAYPSTNRLRAPGLNAGFAARWTGAALILRQRTVPACRQPDVHFLMAQANA
ncbi:hypothetical protein EAM01S_23_00070 [Erwinia amylovora NBRC 12687 = CFBP 1232]|nr:hypothetical protein EAM01S_23_00070 [Erwinia amylovora NBRC 12687 = CFBP 1232]